MRSEDSGVHLGFQLSTWEFIWECEGSFPHTLWHSWEHVMWLPCLFLGPQPCNPLALVVSPRLGLWHKISIQKLIYFTYCHLYGASLGFGNPNLNINYFVMMLTLNPPFNKFSQFIFNHHMVIIVISIVATYGT